MPNGAIGVARMSNLPHRASHADSDECIGDILIKFNVSSACSACKWPYAVATAFGGCRRTLVAVKPGTLMNELSIADKNVDTAGEPNAACQKFTKSTTESNLIAADAE